MTASYVRIVPYSHKISTRKLCFSFIRYIKYVAVTSLYIYNLIRESFPTNVYHEMWDVSSVWTVHVACFRTRKLDNFWAILFILVRPSCIYNVIFHTKFVNYYDVLKSCSTNRKSGIQRMEMDNVQVTAVRQEIVNHSLLVKALIQVLVFLLRSFIILWVMHILGVIRLSHSSTAQTYRTCSWCMFLTPVTCSRIHSILDISAVLYCGTRLCSITVPQSNGIFTLLDRHYSPGLPHQQIIIHTEVVTQILAWIQHLVRAQSQYVFLK
jgi:hypothetical protein